MPWPFQPCLYQQECYWFKYSSFSVRYLFSHTSQQISQTKAQNGPSPRLVSHTGTLTPISPLFHLLQSVFTRMAVVKALEKISEAKFLR